jgi:predicted O-methyltransferase YrrM
MTKIRKLLKALGLIISRPYLLNLIIDQNENWKKKVEKDHELSSGLPEVSFHDLAGGREITVKPFSFMEGGSIPTDLALLRILASRIQECRYFEIGTWRGESVANVSDVAKECVTLNLPAVTMKEMGLPEDYIAQHAMYSKGLKNVIHLEGDSADFDFAGLKTKYDLVFIDGDHHYNAIKRDTENVFKHLVRNRSIVVWHDYAFQPGEIRFETLAAILDGIPSHLKSKVYAVRNTLCAMYFPGEVISNTPSSLAHTEEAFKVKLDKIN